MNWSSFRKTGYTDCLMWQTVPESCTTRICSRRTAGRSLPHGANSPTCVKPFRTPPMFTRCIWDIRTHGLVWHRGMHWQSVCPLRPPAAMSTPERRPLRTHIRKLPKRTRYCWITQNRIPMRTAITMPALLLQEGNLQCTVSEAMRCRKFSR